MHFPCWRAVQFFGWLDTCFGVQVHTHQLTQRIAYFSNAFFFHFSLSASYWIHGTTTKEHVSSLFLADFKTLLSHELWPLCILPYALWAWGRALAKLGTGELGAACHSQHKQERQETDGCQRPKPCTIVYFGVHSHFKKVNITWNHIFFSSVYRQLVVWPNCSKGFCPYFSSYCGFCCITQLWLPHKSNYTQMWRDWILCSFLPVPMKLMRFRVWKQSRTLLSAWEGYSTLAEITFRTHGGRSSRTLVLFLGWLWEADKHNYPIQSYTSFHLVVFFDFPPKFFIQWCVLHLPVKCPFGEGQASL